MKFIAYDQEAAAGVHSVVAGREGRETTYFRCSFAAGAVRPPRQFV